MFRNIILHWTAGDYYPNATDLMHYHYLVDRDGIIHKGRYKPSDNLNCTDGNYAAHCGGGNTGRIGIALCCRLNYEIQPKPKQLEAFCKLAAQLCILYGLEPTDCVTHAEWGVSHPKTSSYGKIDINYIPNPPITGIKECGDYLREKISWYYIKLKNKEIEEVHLG